MHACMYACTCDCVRVFVYAFITIFPALTHITYTHTLCISTCLVCCLASGVNGLRLHSEFRVVVLCCVLLFGVCVGFVILCIGEFRCLRHVGLMGLL